MTDRDRLPVEPHPYDGCAIKALAALLHVTYDCQETLLDPDKADQLRGVAADGKHDFNAWRERALAAESRADDYEEALRHEIAAWQKATGCKTPGESESRAERAEASLAAAERERDRWRHGVPIEGDYVCPDSLALAYARKALDYIASEASETLARIDAHLSGKAKEE